MCGSSSIDWFLIVRSVAHRIGDAFVTFAIAGPYGAGAAAAVMAAAIEEQQRIDDRFDELATRFFEH